MPISRREFLLGSVGLFLAGCQQEIQSTYVKATTPPQTATSLPTASPTSTKTPTLTPAPTVISTEIPPTPELNPRPQTVFSIYFQYDLINNSAAVDQLFNQFDNIGANSLVIDIKNEKGGCNVPFDHPLKPINKDFSLDQENLYNFIQRAQQKNIYLIGRQAVMLDYFMAIEHPEIILNLGGLVKDRSHNYWLNPFDQRIGDYHATISSAALDFGLNAIQLDYIRFPFSLYDIPRQDRISAIVNTISPIHQAIIYRGLLTADLYGDTTTEQRDMGLGQDIPSLAPYLDGISPMYYPGNFSPEQIFERTQNAYSMLQEGGNLQAFVAPWIKAYDTKLNLFQDSVAAAIQAGAIGTNAWNNQAHYFDNLYHT